MHYTITYDIIPLLIVLIKYYYHIYIDYTYVFATLKCEILNEKMQFFELQWHLKIVVKNWEKNF